MRRALAVPLLLLLALSPTASAQCASSWSQIDADDRRSGHSLGGVAVRTTERAWVVGNTYTRRGSAIPLIKRWDGTRWIREPAPNPGNAFLDDVDGGKEGALWAVGDHGTTTLRTFALKRVAGGKWVRRDPANPSGSLNALSDVSVLGRHHAWAVGTYWDAGGQHRVLIEHWNGRRWNVAPVSTIGLLDGVYARTAKDVWAVGRTVRGGGPRTLTLHFNGRRWREVPSPNENDRPHYLYGVAARSRTEAWAVGERTGHRGRSVPIIMRWNGERWRLTDAGLRDGVFALPRGVSVLLDETVIVGEGDTGDPPFILTHTNAGWEREDTSSFEESALLYDVEHAPRGGVMAAGYRSTSNGSEVVLFRPPCS